jgi:hypothetical protein
MWMVCLWKTLNFAANLSYCHINLINRVSKNI